MGASTGSRVNAEYFLEFMYWNGYFSGRDREIMRSLLRIKGRSIVTSSHAMLVKWWDTYLFRGIQSNNSDDECFWAASTGL